MNITTKKLNKKNWTIDWIPISYYNLLSKKQLDKSNEYYWSDNYNLLCICRVYYVNKNRVEIGDVWLNEICRGKLLNNEKISLIFMKKVISKIWVQYKNINKITLIVHNDNIPAIKLYKKLRFKEVKGKDLIFKIENSIFMERIKIIKK